MSRPKKAGAGKAPPQLVEMKTVTLTGKFLIRRSRTPEGRPVLIVCGVAIPSTDIDEFDPNDEGWAARLTVSEAARYARLPGQKPFSPEDFLEDLDTIFPLKDPVGWEKKARLKDPENFGL